MNAAALKPFGRALLAWSEGDTAATITVRREDGLEAPMPAGHFFREEPDFTEGERIALSLCRGRVLDIGAGTGSQSAVLQSRGLDVTALDFCADAVALARRRGVTAVCADIFQFDGGPFDTLLMSGHGIGMVETIEGLKRFLIRAHSLTASGGQLLLDSLDVRVTDDPKHLAYHERKRRAGDYVGEIRMQFEFRGETGAYFGWLQVDADTLTDHATSAGWNCEIVHRDANGNYLARLVRAKR